MGHGWPAFVPAVGPALTELSRAARTTPESPLFRFAHLGRICHRHQPGATLNAALEAAYT
jgi:hypothetical protein